MDTLLKVGPMTADNVIDFIDANFPDFRSYVAKENRVVRNGSKDDLAAKFIYLVVL
jgi:hypothetical protein